MEKKKNAGRLPAAVSLVWLTATGASLWIFYYLTKYLPFLLGGIVILFTALVCAAVSLFCGDAGQSKEPRGDDIPQDGTPQDGTPQDGTPQDGTPQDGTPQDGTPQDSGQQNGGKIRRILHSAARLCRSVFSSVRTLYFGKRTVLVTALVAAINVAAQVLFWIMFRRATSIYKLGYLYPVILVVYFVTYIIFENWCSHTECGSGTEKAILRNIRSALASGRLVLVLISAAAVIKLLGFYDLMRPVDIALAVILCYAAIFMDGSFAVKILRREISDDPDVSIPTPFSLGSQKDLGVLSYLEKNTGITMRSLWSMKLIKTLLPYTVMLSLLIFWLSTGIVQVEAYEEGAVYRFGRLSCETLDPGLHMTLPWPFDKVEKYDTGAIKTLTIGYISSDATDNTWTGTHGSNEYRLLLGGGNELVSINLRLEYRIDDLDAYLRSSSSPEKLLEANAYELVTDRTIVTDLDSLLSADRNEFSVSFKKELSEKLGRLDTGLELVGVVLESIHPPIEIASVYQEIVGAEVMAEKYILDAEARAAVTIAEAERSRNSAISAAGADASTKIAAATADVAEFMASVEADHSYSDNYRYYKYLSAVGQAYGSARLVIVGKGIDSSNIYFGGIAVVQ